MNNNKKYPYIVMIFDWTSTGSHIVKGAETLEEAKTIARDKVAEHQELKNRILIIRGDIVQIGSE